MNIETGEIKELNTEEHLKQLQGLREQKTELESKIQELDAKIEDKRKWQEIPIGAEVDINGLKFTIHHARVDTQEVVLKPVTKIKLSL